MHADDTTLIVCDQNINSLHMNILVELNEIGNWIVSNKLKQCFKN